MELIVLASLLGLSLLGHVAFFFFSRSKLQALQRDLAAAAKKRPLDVTAEELLRDLVSSGAVVRIERIDPGQLLMWRPS